MTHEVTERWLRQELQELREAKGLNRRQAADATGMHVRTIERIETGPDPVSALSLAKLMHAYQPVRDALRQRLRDMRDLAYLPGWWDDWHDIDLNTVYAEHCELEEIATGVDLYAPTIFHGLVQSPGYAQYIQSVSPNPASRDGWLAGRLVDLRVERQRRFWAKRRKVRLLTDEMLLAQPHRGPLREQVDYVLDLQRQGRLEARFLPLTDSLVVPDIFMLLTVQQRQAVCLGGFAEYHVEDPQTLTDAHHLFERAWPNALPLASLRDRMR